MEEFKKSYQKSSSVVSRVIEDEVILVPIRQSAGDLESIYTLNKVGARIWELIDGTKDVKEIAQHIAEEFEVSAGQAEEDTLYFINQLKEVDAISEAV